MRPTTEFIGRFLPHVLPRGFKRIRHCGPLTSVVQGRFAQSSHCHDHLCGHVHSGSCTLFGTLPQSPLRHLRRTLTGAQPECVRPSSNAAGVQRFTPNRPPRGKPGRVLTYRDRLRAPVRR
ncbi:MAG: transposase [Zoogloeaceae bacterium]|nr:transposase [Zoogloeaceae bacterium]